MASDRPEGGEVPLLYSEGNVAARVALEREVRGWSTTELAERVTRAGIKMNQTAVWRIENGTPVGVSTSTRHSPSPASSSFLLKS